MSPRNKTPEDAEKRSQQATAHLRDKVAVLESFVDAGGVPDGYDWPGWKSKHKDKRLKEGKMLALSGTEAFRFWHDPDREFKVKRKTVAGVHKIGSPNTLTASKENIELTERAKHYIEALQKIADTSSSKVIKELKSALEAKDALLQDITNQVVGVGRENKKLQDQVNRYKSEANKLNEYLEKARAELRALKGTVPFQSHPGGRGSDDEH